MVSLHDRGWRLLQRDRVRFENYDMSKMFENPPIIIATLLHEHGATGVQAHFNAFKEYLLARGEDVRIVTPFDAQRALVYPMFGMRYEIDRVHDEASVWWYRHWHYVFLKQALRERLRDGRPAVVYAQCPLSAKAALEGRMTLAQRVIMIAHFNVSQAHEWAEKGKIASRGKLYRSIERLEQTVLPRLDGIVYVSRFLQGQLEMRIPGLKAMNAAVVPNFVRPPETGDDGIYGDLINIGTLEPRKNQRYLIEVLVRASRMGHPYTLTLVGDGPDRSMLEQLAREYGLVDQITFLGNRSNAARYVQSHRLYAHVARMESCGIVPIEARAAGVPVIAAPVGGVPEIYRSGMEGLFWPLDDPKNAACRLIDLLEDSERLKDMTAAARQRYLTAYIPDIAARRLLEFLYATPLAKDIAV